MQTGSDCYMLTSSNRLMPATFACETTDAHGYMLYAVRSRSGRTYTTSPDNVFDAEAGRRMILRDRAEDMVRAGYEVALRADGAFRVFHAAKHGPCGGYIVSRIADGLICDCPANVAEDTCKHVHALPLLLIQRANRLRAAGCTEQAESLHDLACQLHLQQANKV